MPEVTLTDQNFDQEVIKENNLPVLVDFWATWCGPCQAQAPIIEEIASEYEGKIKVGKLEVDQNPAAASRYNILSIPTLTIFVKGQLVKQLVGLQAKKKLEGELNQVSRQ